VQKTWNLTKNVNFIISWHKKPLVSSKTPNFLMPQFAQLQCCEFFFFSYTFEWTNWYSSNFKINRLANWPVVSNYKGFNTIDEWYERLGVIFWAFIIAYTKIPERSCLHRETSTHRNNVSDPQPEAHPPPRTDLDRQN